jgi:hypothetical protein
MPNIRTYDQQIDAPHANMGGMQDPVAAAQSASVGLKTSAKFLEEGSQRLGVIQEQNETSKLSANLAITQANLTNKWQDTIKNADPNDPEVAKNFMENEVGPALDKVGEGLGTTGARDMYARARAGVQASFMVKAHSDQAELAGVAAVQNYVTAKNQLTSATLVDPTSLDTNMMLGNLVIDGLKNIPVEKRLELKTGLAKEQANAHIVGIANNDPAAAQKELDSGKFDKFMDSADKTALQSHITALADAKKSADRAAQVEQTRQNKEAVNQVGNQITATTVRDDGSLAVPADFFKSVVQMSHMPDADVSQIRAMIDYGRAVIEDQQRGRPAITDPVTYDDLTSRMFLEASDPNHLPLADVYRARADRHLSDKDFSFIHGAVVSLAKDPGKALQMRQFNDIAAGLKGYIDKSSPFLGQVNAVTADKYMQFKRDAKPIFDREIAKGTPLNEIEKQIRAIVPTYAIGKKEAIQAIKSYATTGLVPGAPVGNRITRQPGESADDFLKRAK